MTKKKRPAIDIPWTAFQIPDADWERARLCADILGVSTLPNACV